VDPATPSDIFLDDKVVADIERGSYELSVAGVSLFLRKEHSLFSPISLSWDMTSRCNFNCAFCYIKTNSTNNEVTFSEAKPILNRLIEKGLFEVHLSGGECLLLKDFLDIYIYLKEQGVFITVFTNGSLIDKPILACWEKLPPSSVEITVYDDDFSSAPYQNILLLREMDICVEVKYTLTKSTLDSFDGVKKWASANNIELLVDSELIDGVGEQHKELRKTHGLSTEQKRELDPERYNELTFDEIGYRTGLPCVARYGTVHISPEFSMSLCHLMKNRWDLRVVDADIALNKIQQMVEKYEDAKLHGCNGCIYSKKCGMCLAIAAVKHEELFVPNGYCEEIKKEYETQDALK